MSDGQAAGFAILITTSTLYLTLVIHVCTQKIIEAIKDKP